MKDVPIPFDLQANDRDRRGLPIPVVVYRDVNGMAHFSVNNTNVVDEVLEKRLCGLCGKPLQPGQIWLIGGPGSSFLEDGMYIDPFTHEDCGRYAVQVCPFLAVRSYARVEGRTLKAGDVHDDIQLHDNQIAPPRPPFFALARTAGFSLVDPDDGSGQKYILPERPWLAIEFWRNGQQITQAEAEEIARTSGFEAAELKWWPASSDACHKVP